METENKPKIYMSSSGYFTEISLVFLGLMGIAMVGISVTYYSTLTLPFFLLGFAIGYVTMLSAVAGLYILYYGDYRALNYFLMMFFLFLVVQINFLLHFHVFAVKSNDVKEERKALTLALDVCSSLSFMTFLCLLIQLKRRGSTIEMIKL
jgi:hypothetical protein